MSESVVVRDHWKTEELDTETLDVKFINNSDEPNKLIHFEVKNFTAKELRIMVEFEKPLEVSQGDEPDELIVRLERQYFLVPSGRIIQKTSNATSNSTGANTTEQGVGGNSTSSLNETENVNGTSSVGETNSTLDEERLLYKTRELIEWPKEERHRYVELRKDLPLLVRSESEQSLLEGVGEVISDTLSAGFYATFVL